MLIHYYAIIKKYHVCLLSLHTKSKTTLTRNSQQTTLIPHPRRKNHSSRVVTHSVSVIIHYSSQVGSKFTSRLAVTKSNSSRVNVYITLPYDYSGNQSDRMHAGQSQRTKTNSNIMTLFPYSAITRYYTKVMFQTESAAQTQASHAPESSIQTAPSPHLKSVMNK